MNTLPGRLVVATRLIARIYEVDPLRCRCCGGTLQRIDFIVEVSGRLLAGAPAREMTGQSKSLHT